MAGGAMPQEHGVCAWAARAVSLSDAARSAWRDGSIPRGHVTRQM